MPTTSIYSDKMYYIMFPLYMHNLWGFLDVEIKDLDRIVQILASEQQGVTVSSRCLSLLILEGSSSIQLEDIIVVSLKIRSSEATERLQTLKLLLKEAFSTCDALNLLSFTVGQENENAAIKLRESHVEDLIVVGSVDLVTLIYLPEVILGLLLVLRELIVE